jgi:hypothetical protein
MGRGFAVAARLASCAALAALVLGAGGGAAATSSAPRVTVFGDSIADALAYVPEARTFLGEGLDLRLELAPCRKLVPIGCPYMGSRPPSVLDLVQTSSLLQLGNIVVVDVGYNDPANNYDTDMAQVVSALLDRGVGHIVWVTMREQNDDYRTINAVIRGAPARWPQLEVADWESASRGHDWFNVDGLHLNAAGALGLAKLLRPYILSACGAACQGSGPAPPHAPRSTRRPSLRGTPVVGRTLTCLPGSWTGPRPIVFSYRWLRNGKVLAGAIKRSRKLRLADGRRLVACRVWASNATGATKATSKPVRVRSAA